MILSQHYLQILHMTECRILHSFDSLVKNQKKKKSFPQNTLELFCPIKQYLKQAFERRTEYAQTLKGHHALPQLHPTENRIPKVRGSLQGNCLEISCQTLKI